jgi:hypothetical protein
VAVASRCCRGTQWNWQRRHQTAYCFVGDPDACCERISDDGVDCSRLGAHYRVLQDLARKHNESISDTLERIVEEGRRARLFDEANAAYAAIAADPEADAAWPAEIAAWDATLADVLEPVNFDEP